MVFSGTSIQELGPDSSIPTNTITSISNVTLLAMGLLSTTDEGLMPTTLHRLQDRRYPKLRQTITFPCTVPEINKDNTS